MRDMKARGFISFFAALVLCAALASPAFAVVEQSESFYAADYANVLSSTTEQMIIDCNGALEQQCQGAQIVVVTVEYLDGMTTDAYAYQLFNSWGVGSAEYSNGMLLLLAVQENKAWLAYGLGLNSVLSTQSVDSMLEEYFWTDFDNGDYDAAVTKLFNALLKWYDDEYSSSVAGAGTAQVNNSYSGNGYYNTYGISYAVKRIVRIGVIVLILLAVFGGGGRGRGGGSWLPWLLLFLSRGGRHGWHDWNDRPPHGGGFGGGFGGGGGRGGGFGGGFGGGSGHGGGGFSGGGGGRR